MVFWGGRALGAAEDEKGDLRMTQIRMRTIMITMIIAQARKGEAGRGGRPEGEA